LCKVDIVEQSVVKICKMYGKYWTSPYFGWYYYYDDIDVVDDDDDHHHHH